VKLDQAYADHDRSPFDYAWNKILGRQQSAVALKRLAELFSIEDAFEHYLFPVLHQIVLGLRHSDLRSCLNLSTALIDQKDARNRTALYWSARRGDVHTTEILLEYGADYNIGNSHDVVPLQHACAALNPNCIPLLLERGADPNHRDHRNQTALFYLASYRDDPIFAQLLLKHGAEIDAQSIDGVTSMICASIRNFSNLVRCFLDHGADIELADNIGTPLLHAITYNCTETAQVLLSRGAKYHALDKYGNNILHIAAKHANSKNTLGMLEANSLTIDVKAVNLDGETAQQLFEKRDEVGEELENAWKDFLGSCTVERSFDCHM
jgi:ankyrin repeat protein